MPIWLAGLLLPLLLVLLPSPGLAVGSPVPIWLARLVLLLLLPEPLRYPTNVAAGVTM